MPPAILPHDSMRSGRCWNARARRKPLLVGLEAQPEHVIANAQHAVVATRHRIRTHELHLLPHDADIGLVAAVVGEAIEPKTVVEMAEQHDVVLDVDVGATATAASSATTHSAAGAHSATTAHPAGVSHARATAATAHRTVH